MTIDKAQAQTLVTDNVSSFCLNNDEYGHDDTTITVTATKELKKSKKKKKKKKEKKRKKNTTRALHDDNDNATAYDKSESESGKSPYKKQKVGVVVSSSLVTFTKNTIPTLPPSICSSSRTPSSSSRTERLLQGNNAPLKEKSRPAAPEGDDVAVTVADVPSATSKTSSLPLPSSQKKKGQKRLKSRKSSSSNNNKKKKKKKKREKVPTTLPTTEERKATGQAAALEILEQVVCDAVVERAAESVTNADNDGTSLQKQEEKHSSSSKKKNKKPLTTAERRAKSSGGVVEGSKKDKIVVAAALPVVATIVAVADADDSVDVDNERRTLIPKPQFRRKKKGTTIVMPSSRKEIERQVSNSGMLESVPHQKSDLVAEIVQEIIEFHPEIESKYSPYDKDPPSGTPRQQLRQHFLQFTEKEMKEFEDYVMPIVPLNNNARYNHQSKQAIRKFFGKDGKLIDKDTIQRCIYGPKAVLNTTGLHPKDYRVYPFSSELIEITKLLTKIVKEELGPDYDDFEFDFNFMEIKMYLGKDMFQDENGNPIQDNGGDSIRVDNNQSVGPHNDLVFDDNGRQDSKDTARGDHPISTFTLGSTRKLVISWFKKGKSKKSKWKKVKSSRCVTELEDGSIFILVPSDEIPQEFHDFLYKTKHEGKFTHKSASGVSFGFVFRSVKSTSFFDIKTNCWKYEKDKNYKELVTKMLNEGERCKKHAAFPESNPKTSKDVEAVKNNIVNFVTNVK